MTANRKKILWTLCLSGVAVLSWFSMINRAIENSFLGEFDNASERYLDDSLKRAVYTFAVVRGVNGIVSVIQNTVVSVSPAGVGVDLAMGEILDPVNDLLERFSWVMLVSTASLGIQKILSSMGKYFGFDILLTISMVVLCAGIWVPRTRHFDFRALGVKLLAVSLIVRFCVPAAGVVGDRVYDLFLKGTYDEASRTLDAMKEDLKQSDIVSGPERDESGQNSFVDEIKEFYDDARRTLALKAKIEGLKRKMAEYADYTVDLIVVFILQTVAFPLAFLWIMAKLAAFLARLETPYARSENLCLDRKPPNTD